MNGVKDENRLARHICIIAERARHVKGGCLQIYKVLYDPLTA